MFHIFVIISFKHYTQTIFFGFEAIHKLRGQIKNSLPHKTDYCCKIIFYQHISRYVPIQQMVSHISINYHELNPDYFFQIFWQADTRDNEISIQNQIFWRNWFQMFYNFNHSVKGSEMCYLAIRQKLRTALKPYW